MVQLTTARRLCFWAFILLSIVCGCLVTAALDCPDIPPNHAIPLQIVGITDPQHITLEYVTMVMPILKMIREAHNIFVERYGIGIQVLQTEHITPDECTPSSEVVASGKKGVYIFINHETYACTEIVDIEPGSNIVVLPTDSSQQETVTLAFFVSILTEVFFQKATDQQDQQEYCTALKNTLVAQQEIADNGIVEGDEECDTYYPLSQLPCSNQKVPSTWTRMNHCPPQNGCRLFQPISECSLNGVRHDIDLCTTLIGLESLPFPPQSLIYGGQCLEIDRCGVDSFQWGVELPMEQNDANSRKRYFPVESVSKHKQYRCSPDGDLSRKTLCFPLTEEEGTLQRPDVKHSCIISFNSWRDVIPVDDSHCARIGSFAHLPCDYIRVRDTTPDLLPSCFFSKCTHFKPDGNYDTSPQALADDSQYKACVSNPDFGFIEDRHVICNENGLEQPRAAFCVLLNQSAPPASQLIVMENTDKCSDTKDVIVSRKTPCRYDWMCPDGEGKYNRRNCQLCDNVNCKDGIIRQSNRRCFGHHSGSSQFEISRDATHPLCDNEDNNLYILPAYPFAPPDGYQCPEGTCFYQAYCKFTSGSNRNTYGCSQGFYLQLQQSEHTECVPESGECGKGVYDRSQYTVTCHGQAPKTGPIPVDLEKCESEITTIPGDPDDITTVIFPCSVPCSDDDWQCSISLHETSPPLDGEQFLIDNIVCDQIAIEQHLSSFRACGTHIFAINLHCHSGNCDPSQRPTLFAPDENVKIYSRDYSETCFATCIDIGGFIHQYNRRPQLGDIIPQELTTQCGYWDHLHCLTDSPCVYGVRESALVCMDYTTRAFIGIAGNVNHLPSCYYSESSHLPPIQQAYCIEINDTCNVKPMCTLYTQQAGIPIREGYPKLAFEFNEDNLPLFEQYSDLSFDNDCDAVFDIFPEYANYTKTNVCGLAVAKRQCFVEIPSGAKLPDGMREAFPTHFFHGNWQLFAGTTAPYNCELPQQIHHIDVTSSNFYTDRMVSYTTLSGGMVYETALTLCTEWSCRKPTFASQSYEFPDGISPLHLHEPTSSPLLMGVTQTIDDYDAYSCYEDTITCPRGCGVLTQNTDPRCVLADLTALPSGQILPSSFVAAFNCLGRDVPSPSVQCLMSTGCVFFEPLCRLKGTLQVLSHENCSTHCDISLCGKHELEIVCRGYTDHNHDPETAINAPLEHCAEKLKLIGISDGLVCENYLACTTWGCSDFYPVIDHEPPTPPDNDNGNGDGTGSQGLLPLMQPAASDHDGDHDENERDSKYTTSKYTISAELCSYMTPQQSISRACSSTCGHGTMERKVVCMENGRILRDHDVNSSRCGLYYARPFHRLPCHVPESQCRAEVQCAVGGSNYSTTMCRWLQTSKDCMPICDLQDHGDGMQSDDDLLHHNSLLTTTPQQDSNAITSVMTDVATHDETVDVLRRCVYRDTSNRHASSSSCYMQSIPSTMSCETTQDACCWNPLLLAESTSSKNTTPRPEFCPPQSPISGVTTFTQLLVGANSNLCGSSSAPAPPSPDTPLIIHLDTEIPLCWVFAGVPGSKVSLYLAHPALHYLTFIDSYPALNGMNSYVRPTFTLDSRQIAAFSNPSQRDDITALDKRHFASLIAVVNSQLYTVLDYIVLEPSPWQSTPSRSDDTTMTGSLALMCGEHPCFNGVCVDGQCQCYGGFSGPACSHFPLCEDTPDLQCEHGGAPIPTTFRPSSYMFDEGVIASLHTMEEQDRALDNAELPPTAIAPCNRCQCIHHYSGTTCDQCDLQCSKFSKVADDCSRCVCQPGYYGEQCNCRHTYLPVHYHRAPRFLEHYFTNIETVSLNTNAFTQWKNTLLHELAMDLQLPRSDLDIDRYGYNSAGKSTTFVVVFTIKSCLPFDLSHPDEAVVPPATYRVGNVTDLVMVTQLLADYTTVYRTPEYNSTPLFFDYVAVMPEYQSQMVTEDDEDGDTMLSPSSPSFLLPFLESLLLTPSPSPASPHLTPAVASVSPHHIAQTATTRPTQQPTTAQALFSPSAPLLLQSTYFTLSSTATGVGQSMNGGFVSAHPLIDEDCPSMDPSESTTPATCYTGATRRPTLDHVPYSKASHTSMSLALILIIVFCVIVPVLILVILLLILWRKRLLCFSDKSAKQDPSNSTTEDIDMTDMTLQEGSSTHSQTSNRSATRQSRRGGKPAPGGASANSRRSKRSSGRSGRDNKEASGSAMASTQSEMVELEDVDLHPEWKKFMGPQGEPIYVNNSTMQSSRIRPDADGNIRKKSLFHRPTIFGGGPKPQPPVPAPNHDAILEE